jgi:translation initiation factor 2 beta subunit (eIF-2beta)/eIF-5
MKVYVTCNVCTTGYPQVKLEKDTSDPRPMTCEKCIKNPPKKGRAR